MIRVLLTGTLASGKTTLANFLGTCPEVYVVREVARDLLQQAPELQPEAEFQQLVATEQTRREAAARRSGKPVVIADRGMPDIRAYSRHFGHDSVSALGWSYDVVFFCSASDIDLSRVDPRFRKLREAMDLAIAEELRRLDTRWTRLAGRVSQRARILSETICDRFGEEGAPLAKWLSSVTTDGVCPADG